MNKLSKSINTVKQATKQFLDPVMPDPSKKDAPLKHLQLIELLCKTVAIKNISYIPEEIKLYEDHIQFRICQVADHASVSHEVTCPLEPETRHVPLLIDGQALRWDLADEALRFAPEFDPTVRGSINPWVSLLDSRVVRVEREYARHNLSPACLAYAFSDNGDSFDWCISDHSCAPLVFELNPVFGSVYSFLSDTYLSSHIQDSFSFLQMYTPSYCKYAGLTPDNFIDVYQIQTNRPLWEPGSP